MPIPITNEQIVAMETVYYTSITVAAAMVTVIIAGLIGNSFSILIFLHKTMRSSISTLLAGLAVTDQCLLALSLAFYVPQGLSPSIKSNELDEYINLTGLSLYPLLQMTKTCSVWLLIAITCERYIVVRFPLKARSWCTHRKAKVVFAVTVVLSIAFNIVRFWEFKVDKARPSELVPLLRRNVYYMRGFSTCAFLVTHFILPFVFLITVNSHIVCIIRARQIGEQNRRRRLPLDRESSVHGYVRNIRTSRMMVVIVLIFLTTSTLPMYLAVTDAMLQFHSTHGSQGFMHNGTNREVVAGYYVAVDISNFLVVLDAAAPFLVYCLFCTRFLDQLKLLVRSWFAQRSCPTEEQNVLLELIP